jgi:hypothetical protein
MDTGDGGKFGLFDRAPACRVGRIDFNETFSHINWAVDVCGDGPPDHAVLIDELDPSARERFV